MQASTVIVSPSGEKVVAAIKGCTVVVGVRRGRKITEAVYTLSTPEQAVRLFNFLEATAVSNLSH